ncbi:MAG: hypothetical protein ABIU96_03880 [Rhodanobacter sp.]
MSASPEDPHDDASVRRDADRANREWQGARTILSALVLTGIIAILAAQLNNHDQIADNARKSQAQIAQTASDARAQFATLSQQILSVQATVVDVPRLRDDVTALKAGQIELKRRQDADDARNDHLADKPNSWRHP